ncbi:hypothetical protein F5Y19DRAFT_479107 [Xylariaceae sp. FL1651]|nr:hypothetical protein F5Y19DRAFT_479107 [Xylariaceae sp. FL1651]
MAFEMKEEILRPYRSAAIPTALKVSIGLLMVDSVIELSFISSMVAWLNRTVSQIVFHFDVNGSTHSLSGLPLNLLVDQGHTSNGAAGTAFVVIGLGGILSLWLRSLSQRRSGGLATFGRYLYYTWLSFNIPALLLTIGALGYVFAVTNAREGQSISTSLAVNLNGSPYSQDSWTPQNWFSAVLRLDLTDRREEIQSHLTVIRGWQYNLIPMFLIQLLETALAFADYIGWSRQSRQREVYDG